MSYGSENEYDGKIVLRFSDDNLEAWGDFYPHEGNGVPIDNDYLRDLLYRTNIVHGVQHDEIHKAFEACSLHGEIVTNVLVAKGDPPVSEVPEYLHFNPLLNKAKLPLDEDAVVDHRERSSFIIVRKGQTLAKHRPMKPGINGTNVFGGAIDFKLSKPVEVFEGENTHMEGDLLVASINGQLIQSKGVLSVKETLHVKGSVGYGTGNIIFPGDVQIDGIVSDGFKVFTGGTLTIKQTFDVSEAVTKNDLIVAGGIIGRGQAKLKVGGSIKTRFIENCRVACRNDIKVELEILNSNVYTMGTLEMGDKGRIVGGEIYALKGIKAGGIGKSTGKAARIHCGVDFTLEQEKERQNNILRILSGKSKQLTDLLDDPSLNDERKKKINDNLLKLEEEQKKTQAVISELLMKMNAFEKATVEVTGEITPGSLVEICQTALFVTTPLKKVRVRLDPSSSKLIIDNL